jgi:hypothetical protein
MDDAFLDQRRFAMADAVRWRDIHIKEGNTREIALYKRDIDGYQADIEDLTARGFQSTRSWVQTAGQDNVSNINKASPAKLHQWAAATQNQIAQGRGVNDNRIFVCVISLRLAKLSGQTASQSARALPPTSAAINAPLPTPTPTRTAANIPSSAAPRPPAPAPHASAEPQFGGGASMGPKSVVADTQPVNQCVVPHIAGEKGNFGRLENVCGFPIDVRFCNDQTKPGSWEASMACTGTANWGGMSDVSAHALSADHVGGHVYWFACRKPSGVSEAKFVPGKGITAHCR